jgi:hypothetical protein
MKYFLVLAVFCLSIATVCSQEEMLYIPNDSQEKSNSEEEISDEENIFDADGDFKWQAEDKKIAKDTSSGLIKAASLHFGAQTNGPLSNESYNFDLQLFVSENVALNYRLGFTTQGNSESFRYNAFQYAAVNGFSYFFGSYSDYQEDCDDCEEESDYTGGAMIVAGIASLFMIVLPEGVSVYTPVNTNTKLSFFVNPLCMEHINQNSYASYSAGMRMHLRFAEKFEVVPYFGYKNLYESSMSQYGLSSLFFGVSIGISSNW